MWQGWRSEVVDALEQEVVRELAAVGAPLRLRVSRDASRSPSVSLDVCELGGEA